MIAYNRLERILFALMVANVAVLIAIAIIVMVKR